ncbi:MAG: sigma-70 family RNA polymerase sigma factor [Saprospiraceae bacterium]|nr:sigma-70 family RNA polymerase sigma factor [Saprospiraceae bacterium]
MNQVQSDYKAFDDEHFSIVYNELKSIAHNKLRFESSNLTLSTTDLVHEAYMKLAGQRTQSFQNRDHFYAMASTAMRRILINYAKQKKAKKRGGDQLRITLCDDQLMTEGSMDDLVYLDEAMNRYQQLSNRGSKIIEYWFFSGFKQKEIADMMNISLATVKREWQTARSWLSREMRQQLN